MDKNRHFMDKKVHLWIKSASLSILWIKEPNLWKKKNTSPLLHSYPDAKAGSGNFSTGGPMTSRRTYSNPGDLESHQLRNGKQVNLAMITGPGAGMSLNTPNTLAQPALHITHSLIGPWPTRYGMIQTDTP